MRTIRIITTIAALATATSLASGDITYKDAWLAIVILALLLVQIIQQNKKETTK